VYRQPSPRMLTVPHRSTPLCLIVVTARIPQLNAPPTGSQRCSIPGCKRCPCFQSKPSGKFVLKFNIVNWMLSSLQIHDLSTSFAVYFESNYSVQPMLTVFGRKTIMNGNVIQAIHDRFNGRHLSLWHLKISLSSCLWNTIVVFRKMHHGYD
jgi:hypothetical protein